MLRLLISRGASGAVIIVMVLAWGSAVALAKEPRGSVFDTPESGQTVPAFVTISGRPLKLEREPQLPGFAQAMLLDDLTLAQRRRIKQLQSESAMRVRTLEEHIASLQLKLDLARSQPGARIVLQGKLMPTAQEAQDQINGLKAGIVGRQKEAYERLGTILTVPQREKLAAIFAKDNPFAGECVGENAEKAIPGEHSGNVRKRRKNLTGSDSTVFGAAARKLRERFKPQNK